MSTKHIREKINKIGDQLPISPRLIRIILEEILAEIDKLKDQKSKS